MIGRALITVSALGQLLGPFIADFNHTHVLNPRWPPHARFHNGQTMSMGVCLGLSTIYYAFRPLFFSADEALIASDSIMTAMIFGSLYWVTGMSAILYPGSRGMDPEFGNRWFPQLPAFVGLLLCTLMGGWLEGGLEASRRGIEMWL